MKKLMIAAAIVCAAAYAQAGSFVWGIQTYESQPPTADYDDGYGYFDGNGAAVLSVLGADSNWHDVATAPSWDESTYWYGSFDESDPASSTWVNALTKSDDPTQQYKITLTTNDGKYMTVWEGTAEVYTVTGLGEDTYIQSMIVTDAHSAGQWVAVPEPTSGLLLILGVAGLALRRRRA